MATAKKTAKVASPARKRPNQAKSAPQSGVKAVPAPTGKLAPAVKAATPSAKAPKAPKADKPKKPKLVRDSFTIPKAEYAVIEALKERSARAGAPAKKSEILRAGIKALSGLSDSALVTALKAVPAIKTGRPSKS